MEKGLKDNIERLKGKAELFLNNNLPVFIKDVHGNYYFCNVVIIGEVYLIVENFIGKRKGERSRIVWYDITHFEEYKEREDEE